MEKRVEIQVIMRPLGKAERCALGDDLKTWMQVGMPLLLKF